MKNIFLKIFIGVIIAFFVLIYLFYKSFSPTKYTSIRNYEKCLNESFYKNDIAHFPKIIPDDAYNIKLYCIPVKDEYSTGLYLLKFKINDKYIDNELKTHEFLNSYDKLGTPQKIYNMPSKFVGIKPDSLTYYVLKNKSNVSAKYKYFPYFSGIGISKDKKTILYYSIRPD